MTRLYIQPSWIDSCSDHGEWSGGNDQYRGDKSIESVPTYINGKPNVKAFSDEAIEARREKKKTSVPLKQRILPQSARVEKLRSEAIELEAAFKAGEFSADEYTLLREVAFKKLRRAEELLKKAITPVQKEEESYEDEAVSYTETFSTPSDNIGHGGSYSSPVGVSFFAEFVDELSSENMFKSFLKSACLVTRTLVRWSQQAAAYYRTLKEV